MDGDEDGKGESRTDRDAGPDVGSGACADADPDADADPEADADPDTDPESGSASTSDVSDGRASDPAGRRQLLVRAVLDARRTDTGVAFAADIDGERSSGGDDTADAAAIEGDTLVEYDDQTLRLAVDEAERTRLAALLEEYRVFKVQQPATRKAPEGVVYLSAVTDAKHAADFVESLFREVYGADEGYELRVTKPEPHRT